MIVRAVDQAKFGYLQLAVVFLFHHYFLFLILLNYAYRSRSDVGLLRVAL